MTHRIWYSMRRSRGQRWQTWFLQTSAGGLDGGVINSYTVALGGGDDLLLEWALDVLPSWAQSFERRLVLAPIDPGCRDQ